MDKISFLFEILTVWHWYKVAEVIQENVNGSTNIAFPGTYKLKEFMIYIHIEGYISCVQEAYTQLGGTGTGSRYSNNN